MKLILMITGLLMAGSAWGQVDCESLSGDSVVLCKQNKRIMRRLRSIANGVNGGGLKACAITYCSYYGKVENQPHYIRYCRSSSTGSWSPKTIDVEARNRAHARVVFNDYVSEQSLRVQSRSYSVNESIMEVSCD